jgi:hypothetical protein
MSLRTLPSHPSLKSIKNQAKQLLRAHKLRRSGRAFLILDRGQVVGAAHESSILMKHFSETV